MRRHAHNLLESELRNDSTVSSSSTDYFDQNGLPSSLYRKPKDTKKNKSDFEIYFNSDLRLNKNAHLLEFGWNDVKIF